MLTLVTLVCAFSGKYLAHILKSRMLLHAGKIKFYKF